MCLHISCFSNYQPINDGIVFMGNDFSCKIIGIGSVKIKMYDGTMRTLTEVRHVTELRKNLISMRVLDATGYKFVVRDGVMKVLKGILTVMKARG